MQIWSRNVQLVLANQVTRKAYRKGSARFDIAPQKCALLVIDKQNEFVKPVYVCAWKELERIGYKKVRGQGHNRSCPVLRLSPRMPTPAKMGTELRHNQRRKSGREGHNRGRATLRTTRPMSPLFLFWKR